MKTKDYEISYRNKPLLDKGGDGIFFFDFDGMFNLEKRIARGLSEERSDAFLDSLRASRHRLGVLMVDVQGHGRDAYLELVGIQGAWSTAIRYELDMNGQVSGEAMNKLNKHMLDRNMIGANTHATATYMEFNPDGIVRFIRAGHPSPIVYREAPTVIGSVGSQTGLLGAYLMGNDFDVSEHTATIDEATTEQYKLGMGDVLLMYTDGLPDLGVPHKTGFRNEVDQYIADNADHRDLEELAAGIEELATDFSEQTDDLTYLLARKL